MSSSRRNSSSNDSQAQDPQPESPLSDRSPRMRDVVVKKKRSSSASPPANRLSPKTPLPLPDAEESPKHPRRYASEPRRASSATASVEKVTDFRLEEVHRPSDRVVHVDVEEIERNPRGGTPSSSFSLPPGSMLDDSLISSGGPRTSTPKKSFRKSRKPESLYKKVLMKSASRPTVRPAAPADDSSIDGYRTAQESMMNSTAGSVMSPIIEAGYRNPDSYRSQDSYRNPVMDGYRSANSTQRALFSQQGAAPLPRQRSSSRSRYAAAPAPATLCQLVTPLAVHTAQEVNAVSVTGQILVISQTLVRSAHASADVRKLMNHLAGKQPLISNEMSQVDIDHDNEHSKHEVFVGSDAILIQRISTIHRGRDRNSFETDDRRTYRFICQGDLLPEDRRDKQTKPRHLTIIAESATVKDCEEIEKSERVVLVFDAADHPTKLLAPMPPEISLTHANDLTARPSALKDSPVSFDEHVRVSDHSHINIVRKARVHASVALWDEPLTELKEQRVYTQQLVEDANCEPVRITRSHSMTRGGAPAVRDRSLSASRRPHTPSRIERGRTPGRTSRNSTMLRPLAISPLANERTTSRSRDRPRPDCTPSAHTADLLTCISPIQDEPARREGPPRRRFFDVDDTVHDSPSMPSRATESSRTPDPNTQLQRTVRFSQTPRTPDITTAVAPSRTARSSSRSPAKLANSSQQKRSAPGTPYKLRPVTPNEPLMRTPPPALQQFTPLRTAQQTRTPPPAMQQLTPLRTARQSRTPPPAMQQLTPLRTAQQQTPRSTPRTPTRPAAAIVDEDTSAGSSQSPTQNRTPTTVSPRRARLTTAVYQSPAATPARSRSRTPSRDPSMHEWDRMLDRTQPISPVSIARRIPDDFMPLPAAPLLSDSRLGRARPPTRSRQTPKPRPLSAPARPLGSAKSWSTIDSPPAPVQQHLQQQAQPLRRAVSLHSVLPAQQQQPAAAPRALATTPVAPAAPANSAIAIASPYRGQQYVSPAAPAAPQPRLPRTTRPAPAALQQPPSSDPIAVSASASATRLAPTARQAAVPPKIVVSKPKTSKNVELVSNPEDYEEGEILKKKLTLEAKINGHLWNLQVVFALKGERADLIRFVPKRVRIDDQTLWEETENWSQTSLTPVTGPRTAARGSSSYDQVLLQPVAAGALPQPGSASASTQTPSPTMRLQSAIRVTPARSVTKAIVTASTASSASSSSSASRKSPHKSKKATSKKSANSKEKRLDGTPFI